MRRLFSEHYTPIIRNRENPPSCFERELAEYVEKDTRRNPGPSREISHLRLAQNNFWSVVAGTIGTSNKGRGNHQ